MLLLLVLTLQINTFSVLAEQLNSDNSDTYIIDYTNNLITNVKPNTKLTDFINNMKLITDKQVKVYDDETELENNELVKPGNIVRIFNSPDVYSPFTIFIYGDINKDGKVNISDMLHVKKAIINKTTTPDMDVTYDGKVNIADIIKLKNIIINNSPAPVKSLQVSSIPNQAYTGSAITPIITVKDGSNELVEGTDYTVTFTNNINAGIGNVIIAGIGNYSGLSGSSTFIIEPKVIDFVIDAIPAQSYTGSLIEPNIIVKDGSAILVSGKDYNVTYENNIEAGMANVVVTGINNYAGSNGSTTFEIKEDAVSLTIGAIDEQEFTGSAITPDIVVKYGNNVLVKDVDYTLEFENNINAGTGIVTVTGIAGYTGATTTASFCIRPKTIIFTIDEIENYSYTGEAITPDINVKDGNSVLEKGKDYTVTYLNNTNIGTAVVLVHGTGNYYGSIGNTSFVIDYRVINFVISNISAKTYTGSEIIPTITVKDGSKTLTKDIHYTMSVTNNINVGTANVTLSGIGVYTGSTGSATFKINPKVTTLSINPIDTQYYTGSPITPIVTVKDGSKVLTLGTDYTVTYSNNTNDGNANVTVTGIGNYAGSTGSAQFKIEYESTYVFKGIDVSHWNGDIDWVKVKAAGIDYAMIRSSYGRGIDDATGGPSDDRDREFVTNITNAKAAGMKVGAYHYSYATTVEQARDEAYYFLNNIKGYKLDYPVAFDIEDPSQAGLTKQQKTDIAKAFCEIVSNAGYYVVIYANKDWLINHLDVTQLSDYDFWLAEWPKDINQTPKYTYTGPAKIGMWQYASDGKVDGISGNVDLDFCYRNYADIIAKGGYNPVN